MLFFFHCTEDSILFTFLDFFFFNKETINLTFVDVDVGVRLFNFIAIFVMLETESRT